MRNFSVSKSVLGSSIELSLTGDLDETELRDISVKGFEQMSRIEKIMSFHDEASELSMINRMAHESTVEISPEMSDVLDLGLRLSTLSDGYYDLTIGACLVENELLPKIFEGDRSQSTWRDLVLEGRKLTFNQPAAIDLGGMIKGYLVDVVANALGETVDYSVSLDGHQRMRPWAQRNAGIRVPDPDYFISLECPMQESAVATSAPCFHDGTNPIFCPYSCEPVRASHSVSVFAESCVLADALTKVAFLAPLAKEIMREMNAVAIVIDDQGGITPFEDYAR